MINEFEELGTYGCSTLQNELPQPKNFSLTKDTAANANLIGRKTKGGSLSCLHFCSAQLSNPVPGVPYNGLLRDCLGDSHGCTRTALDASRWLKRHVPRRTSGSSSCVLACKMFLGLYMFRKHAILYIYIVNDNDAGERNIYFLSFAFHFPKYNWYFWIILQNLSFSLHACIFLSQFRGYGWQSLI